MKIDGLDILDDPTEAKKRIGFLPEQPPLYTEMTVGSTSTSSMSSSRADSHRRAHLDEVMQVTRVKDVQDRYCESFRRDTARGSA